MLMPLDIINKKFKKSFKGYNTEEVDKFLEEMIDDYEKLYKENIELKDKIAILNEGIQHYKTMEHTLQDTLLIAQKTSEDIKTTAYQKAEIIKRESEFEAEEIRNRARIEVQKLRQECEVIKKEYEMFRMKFKAILTSELQILDEPLSFKNVKIDSDDIFQERNQQFNTIEDAKLERSRQANVVNDSVLEKAERSNAIEDSVLEKSQGSNEIEDSALVGTQQSSAIEGTVLDKAQQSNVINDTVLERNQLLNQNEENKFIERTQQLNPAEFSAQNEIEQNKIAKQSEDLNAHKNAHFYEKLVFGKKTETKE